MVMDYTAPKKSFIVTPLVPCGLPPLYSRGSSRLEVLCVCAADMQPTVQCRRRRVHGRSPALSRRHTIPDTDAVENNTNKVGRFGQGQRGIECKLRPDLERCFTVVVTGPASGNVKTGIWIWLLTNPETRRAHCLGDD